MITILAYRKEAQPSSMPGKELEVSELGHRDILPLSTRISGISKQKQVLLSKAIGLTLQAEVIILKTNQILGHLKPKA